MVGIVVVSHSSNLAERVKEVASQMSSEVSIQAAGGTLDSPLLEGTIIAAVEASIGKSITEIVRELNNMKINKMN